MSYYFLSDLHLPLNSGGEKEQKKNFLKRLESQLCHDSDEQVHLYLLGDIFDIAVGDFQELVTCYEDFFSFLENIFKDGKVRVVFLEGNHDFHLYSLFRKAFPEEIRLKRFLYKRDPFAIDLPLERRAFLFHGDEFEEGKHSRYRRVVKSLIMRFVANHFLPYMVVKKIALTLKKNSEGLMSKNLKFKDELKEKYLKICQEILNENPDEQINLFICGHTHVRDHWIHQDREGKEFEFYNVGDSFVEASILCIKKDGRVSFIK